MGENGEVFFHRLCNKHHVKRIVMMHRKSRHRLCMGETDWQLDNSRITAESSYLLGGHRYLVGLYGMLDSHLPH